MKLPEFIAARAVKLPETLLKTLIAKDGVSLSRDSSLFAKFLTGTATPPYKIEKTPCGEFAFFRNRPDNDARWDSMDSNWIGKASMSKFHRFIVPTTFHDWRWFNAVTLPPTATDMLKRAREVAMNYPASHGVTNVGLYLHCYPHNSINMLHIHIVDLDHVGPSFNTLAYKNLLLDDTITALEMLK